MTTNEHLLSCLAEECAEVAQRVSKALRFGPTDVQPGQDLTNAQRIVGEVIDLLAVAEMLEDAGVMRFPRDLDGLFAAKMAKVREYLAYARECGTVSDGEAPHGT